MSVPKRLRFEVFRRDGFRCRYCGATPDEAQLRPDHVVPEALGGKTEPTNLVTACEDCNAGKASMLISGTIDDIDERTIQSLASTLLNIVSDHLGDDYINPLAGQVVAEGIPPLFQLEECARRVVVRMSAELRAAMAAVR
ncbi:HNH endonuclease [Dactylosporangium sp. NPDC005572]|uniref:HNH endonuclease n=1 Tax=Dactylosporangium sp. NPDC005572 TaxID=3156889 RepID=UPI0033AB92F0